MEGKTMKSKYDELAENIMKNIGGKDNIISLTHCMTRLRFDLRDDRKAAEDALNATEGIIGTIRSGRQLQIVIGSHVADVCTAICGYGSIRADEPERKSTAKWHPEEIKTVAAPASGRVRALSEIEDKVFATGALGAGAAIVPSDGKIFAPVDGRITTFFSTGHALSLTSDDGIEILIHVGMDTVQLKGEGFAPKAKQGDRIKKGDLLLEVDLEKIKAAGCPVTTPVIITNTDQYADIVPTASHTVEAGETLIKII